MKSHIRITIFETDKEPLNVQLDYADKELRTNDPAVVQIAVGNDTARASVTLPLEVLLALVPRAVMEYEKRKSIVAVKPPPLVMPFDRG